MQTECSENFLGCTYTLFTINPTLSTLCPSSPHIKVIKNIINEKMLNNLGYLQILQVTSFRCL